ncbi:MAG: hypothetical protein LBH41_00130 [Rickettsiales bacterium]|jgi:hypothetical protein|nr:hypothetical protein [Rickettsiales bacterium]
MKKLLAIAFFSLASCFAPQKNKTRVAEELKTALDTLERIDKAQRENQRRRLDKHSSQKTYEAKPSDDGHILADDEKSDAYHYDDLEKNPGTGDRASYKKLEKGQGN